MKLNREKTNVYARERDEMLDYVRTHIGSLLILFFIVLPTSVYFVINLYSWLIYNEEINLDKLFVSFVVSLVSLLVYLLITEYIED